MVEKKVEAAPHPDNHERHEVRPLDPVKAKRMEALSKCFGLWKDRTDIPKDGLEYQRMMREGWDG